MIRLTNVLVATDFSEPSDAALEYGHALADAFHAALRVLHVVTEPTHEVWAGYTPGAAFLKTVESPQS